MYDAALVAGAIAGSAECFAALVERHQRAVHALAYRWLADHAAADEVVQATFVQAYTHLAAFRGESCAEPTAVAERLSDGLGRLVGRLPARQRAVVTLRVVGDLAWKEIARLEGISENAAKVSYHHAVTRLRQWLGRV